MATLGNSVSARTRMWGIAVVVAFLVGLIPMWIIAGQRATQIEALSSDLRKSSLKERVALAALHGRRGEYEQSRQAASDFFTSISSRLDSADTKSQPERDTLTKLLQERDQIITLLARNDPAGVDRLFAMQYEVAQALP